jgi:hypothetical protein
MAEVRRYIYTSTLGALYYSPLAGLTGHAAAADWGPERSARHGAGAGPPVRQQFL